MMRWRKEIGPFSLEYVAFETMTIYPSGVGKLPIKSPQ